MNRAALAVVLVALAAYACQAAEGDASVFQGIVQEKWLSKDTVNFENLKYTNTYPVLFFWQQCRG